MMWQSVLSKNSTESDHWLSGQTTYIDQGEEKAVAGDTTGIFFFS